MSRCTKSRFASHREIRSKYRIACLAASCIFSVVQIVTASPPPSTCSLPPSLVAKISDKFPDTRVVTLADLNEYDRGLFVKDHGAQCPGLVKVDFYGDGKPTWAIVLIAGENPRRKAVLVVARMVGDRWDTRLLETTDGTPVIWRESPGKYAEFDSDRTIRAPFPVIMLVGYESWSVLYSWTGKEVQKVQLTD